MPYWQVNLQFYGPEATNASNWEYAKAKIAAAVDGATFEEVERLRFPLTEEQKHNARHRVAIGVPNLEIFFIGARSELNPTPSDGHVWFSPVIPKSGEAILDFQETMSKAVRDAGGFPGGLGGYGPFSAPATWMYRTFIMISGLPVVRNNPEFNKRTRDLFNHLIDVAAEKGWGEYRTHPLFYDKIMGTYSFNDTPCCASTSASRTPSTPTASSRPVVAGSGRNILGTRSDDETNSAYRSGGGARRRGSAAGQDIGEAPTFARLYDHTTLTSGSRRLHLLVLELSRGRARQTRHRRLGGPLQRGRTGAAHRTHRP